MSRYVVVKLGGHALETTDSFEAALDTLATDLEALINDQLSPVVVHGAGPQINTLLSQLAMASTTIDGLRVTTGPTMDVVAMALSLVNIRIVAGLNRRGVASSGLAGPDRSMVRASRKGPQWDLVGDQIRVSIDPVIELCELGVVPIVNPVAVDEDGTLLNCNADAVAGALVGALQGEALVLLSDVDQIRRDPDDPTTALATVSRTQVAEMIASGAVRDGMVPKLTAALVALDAGARRVVVANASRANALTGALRHEGIYTEVTA